ncbi:hypothetical protein DRO55_00210 [Candidatus Bathyarchaeota archaeon]|nr:MAG: hypothetical protein DRO55_00210 [Candidatus Bathyarchaeota archaeon]
MTGASLRPFISVNPEKCIGCGLCECVCALEKEGVPNPLISRIRVIRVFPLLNVALTCRFCEEAPCVNACTRDAMRRLEDGVIAVDEEKCDACGWCIEACPYGGLTFNPNRGVPVACDLCGGEPKCVEFCPEEALELVSDDKASRELWSLAVKRLPSRIERLTNMMKKMDFTEIFEESEDRMKRLEEKLEAFNRRIAELVKS